VSRPKTIYSRSGCQLVFPVDEKTVWEPNMIIGAGISTNFKGIDATVGAALMWSRSGKKQFEADFRENLEKSGYKTVEEAKDITPRRKLCATCLVRAKKPFSSSSVI